MAGRTARGRRDPPTSGRKARNQVGLARGQVHLPARADERPSVIRPIGCGRPRPRAADGASRMSANDVAPGSGEPRLRSPKGLERPTVATMSAVAAAPAGRVAGRAERLVERATGALRCRQRVDRRPDRVEDRLVARPGMPERGHRCLGRRGTASQQAQPGAVVAAAGPRRQQPRSCELGRPASETAPRSGRSPRPRRHAQRRPGSPAPRGLGPPRPAGAATPRAPMRHRTPWSPSPGRGIEPAELVAGRLDRLGSRQDPRPQVGPLTARAGRCGPARRGARSARRRAGGR